MGTPKAASELLLKLLKSAASNAENNHQMDPEKLYVSQVFACPGPIIKRMMPRAQGRAYRINKRTSHITIAVAEQLREEEEYGTESESPRPARGCH